MSRISERHGGRWHRECKFTVRLWLAMTYARIGLFFFFLEGCRSACKQGMRALIQAEAWLSRLPAARESVLSLSSCCRSREIRSSDSAWEFSFVRVEKIMPSKISIPVQFALGSAEQLKRGNLVGWELQKWGNWMHLGGCAAARHTSGTLSGGYLLFKASNKQTNKNKAFISLDVNLNITYIVNLPFPPEKNNNKI